jgi:transcriptional regulator GlxA family with amidase domain
MKPVQILLFDDVEVLDFAGPFEVFAICNDIGRGNLFDVKTVSTSPDTVIARWGMRVVPDYAIASAPWPDILVIPGGFGSRAVSKQPTVIDWVLKTSAQAEIVMSVCTGAMILAKAGLLDRLKVTTHHENLDELIACAPKATVIADVPFVDNGKIITTAGVSAGISGSLHIVQRVYGGDVALMAAKAMEYDWNPAI